MKINKTLIPVAGIILTIVLTACAPLEFESYPDETGVAGATSVNNADRLGTEDTNTLPVETQLILGTLLLEGTDQAVNAQQAALLLPLWQKWHDLNRSNTAAPADRDALLEQIQSAMTEEQIQAITGMNLTQQDVLTYIDKNGVGSPGRPTGTPSAGDDDGTPPPGNDGGNPFSDGTQTLSPEELATLQSVYQGGFGGSHGPEWALLHTLIDLLEGKLGLTPTPD
ncbi:MAG: hypothetical protein WBM17_09985 [Anaerolineales bacterium]